MGIFGKIFGQNEESQKEEQIPDYIELETGREEAKKLKVSIRPFVLKNFDDVNKILEVLREGESIALIDIKELKQKDIIELKRTITKLKKTVDALDGSIAGFGENVIIATPAFAQIYREQQRPQPQVVREPGWEKGW